MREFKKSYNLFYIYLFIFIIFTIGGLVCLTNLGKTNIHLGFDLFLIFAFILFALTLPYLFKMIHFLYLPKIILSISKNEFIIHYRKKNRVINARRLLSVSKVNNVLERFGFNFGDLKILFKDDHIPVIIKYLDDLDEAYNTLNVLIIGFYQ